MTRRAVKRLQKQRARIRANRTRHNIAKYNQPRVKMGRAGMTTASRSGPGQRNVLEMLVQNAVRMAMQRSPTLQPPPPVRKAATKAGASLVDALVIGALGVLLAALVYWLTGCTPRY